MTAGEVELVLDARAELGEGPLWDGRRGRLFWVDILRGRVHAFDPASGGCRSWEVGRSVGVAVPADSGGLVLGTSDGFGRLDLETGRFTLIAEVEADRPDQRMNDGKCDAAGRLWAGTMALDCRACAGSLYRLDRDGRVQVMRRDVTISNGLDWSLDGRLMYYVDSGTQSIAVFDFEPETGTMKNPRSLVSIPPELGMPDGLTVDAEGFLWVALWGGGAVHRYSPGGALDRVVRLPVSHPTSCVFGGADLRDLYITTATIALSPAERERQPQAGGIFRHRPGVAGRPAAVFRG
jgi:sugar lactone lactonase YvrE